MSNAGDTLSEKQKEVADLIVQNAIDSKTGKTKKMSQEALGEAVGVTGRTIRNWQKDRAFLEYIRELSTLRLQAAMPEFVAVLIANLDKGQNLSTKQLDLIAKVADWMPEPKSANQTLNITVGSTDIEDRIAQLEARRKEATPVPIRTIEATEVNVYETD